MIIGVWLMQVGEIGHVGWLAVISMYTVLIGGILLVKPTPSPKQAVATQAANAEVVEKAGEVSVAPAGERKA